MKHIKSYKVFESNSISKSELVNKIKYYSNWLNTYINDYNKYTTSEINLGFTYGNLPIYNLFRLTQNLKINSEDGLIKAIVNEFLLWMNFIEKGWRKKEYEDFNKILTDYDEYTDEYKEINRIKIYNSDLKEKIYIYITRTIYLMTLGTIWEIPKEKEKFSEYDKQVIINSLLSDYDDYIDDDYMNKLSNLDIRINNSGLLILLPKLDHIKLNYDSDFISRLQDHFGGVLIKDHTGRLFSTIILPFYK